MNLRRFLILSLTLLLSLPFYSQQLRRNFERELSVGVSGGLELSRVSFLHNDVSRMSELGNQGFHKGYRFGVVSRFISQKHFGVQVEVNFMRTGWSELFHEDGGISMVHGYNLQDVRLTRNMSYIEVPALAHIYFGDRRVRFFIELGPQFAFQIHYGDLKLSIPENDNRMNAFRSDDPRWGDDRKKLDYGIAGGIGFDIKTGRFHTIVGGRFTYGFSDLYSNSKADVFQRSNSQLLNVSAAFLVPVLTYKEKKR